MERMFNLYSSGLSRTTRSLLDHAFGDPFNALTNNFAKPKSLKIRIAMLYKKQNSNWALGMYPAVLALVSFVALSMAFKPAVVAEIAHQNLQLVEVKGVVVDTRNKPLTDVVIKTADLRNLFVTDKSGQYKLSVPSGSELIFQAVGYKALTLKLKNDQIVNAVLAETGAADSSALNVYPWLTEERANPDQTKQGQLIPKFLPGIEPRKDTVLTFRYRFLSAGAHAQPPSFPGGNDALRAFIERNASYPTRAARANVQGKVLIVFTVSSTGEIQEVDVVKGIGFGLGEEAKRLVAAMPRWIPGRQEAKAVATPYHLTLNYQLAANTDKIGAITAQVRPDGDAGSVALVQLHQVPTNVTRSVQGYFNGFGEQYGLTDALHVVDGSPLVANEKPIMIPTDQIASVNIIRGAAAEKLYGQQGKNGVVDIVTKKAPAENKKK